MKKQLKLTAPTLLIMGKTGRIGNNEDAPNFDEVRQQIEILLRTHDEMNSTSVLLKVNADGTFIYETILNTTREVKRFKALWKMEGESVTVDFLNQTQINKDMNTNEDDELMEDDAMYPAGLEMQDTDDENDRNVLNDDDDNNPLDRDNGIFISKDDDGMYPAGVK